MNAYFVPGLVLCRENIKIKHAVSFLKEDIVKEGDNQINKKLS